MGYLRNRHFGLVAIVFLLASCGGNKFQKSKVDELIRDLPSDRIFFDNTSRYGCSRKFL